MGGLFSSPSPPAQEPTPAPKDPEEAEREARLEAIARRRRGRSGTIKTSASGTLAPAPGEQTDKTKLGE